MPGYSGTALATKLGYKPGQRACVLDAPAGYRAWLAPLADGVVWLPQLSAEAGLVHLFVTTRATLSAHLYACCATLGPTAVIWVSWPKKAAKVATDVTEDTIRELALPLGLVDIKVCAVSEIWSGLKLMRRKALR